MRSSRLVIVATFAAATASLAPPSRSRRAPRALRRRARAAVATLPPGWFAYRPLGDFEADGHTIDAPARATRLDAPLDVMVEPVSQADYARCVAAAACPKLKGVDPAAADLPVVGVSWLDATAYAEWYARATGEDWRLPTDEEWAYAAAERFRGEPPPAATRRRLRPPLARQVRRRIPLWRASRRRRSRSAISASTRSASPTSPATSGNGPNSCYERRAVEPDGEARLLTRNCHVRALEGEHRTFMSDFIRDGVDRRLLGRPAADQSRLPPGARSRRAPSRG